MKNKKHYFAGDDTIEPMEDKITEEDFMKVIIIESIYKNQNSKKKLEVCHLIENSLIGLRIFDGDEYKGSIVLDINKLRNSIK